MAALQLILTGDYIGGMFGPDVLEDSPIVTLLLAVHHLIFG